MKERGEEKLMDLQLLLAPHTKDPNDTVQQIRRGLLKMIGNEKPKQHGRRR